MHHRQESISSILGKGILPDLAEECISVAQIKHRIAGHKTLKGKAPQAQTSVSRD